MGNVLFFIGGIILGNIWAIIVLSLAYASKLRGILKVINVPEEGPSFYLNLDSKQLDSLKNDKYIVLMVEHSDAKLPH